MAKNENKLGAAETSTGKRIEMTRGKAERSRVRIEMSAAAAFPTAGAKKKKSPYLMDRLLDPLEKKWGRYAPKHIMNYIIGAMLAVFVVNAVMVASKSIGVSLIGLMTFDRGAILSGQVWRVLSFVLVPETGSYIGFVLELYFSWLIAKELESEWGAFRFNAYYFTGVLGCIAAGFIAGWSTNIYLNLGLFFAYALFFPNERFLVFFIIPVKAKWLALADGLFLLYTFITAGTAARIVIPLSLLNLFLFFGRDMLTMVKGLMKKRRR